MVDGRKIPSHVRWNIAGTGALILATIVLACAVGIVATRTGEPIPIVSAPPLMAQKPIKTVVIGDSYTEGTAAGGLGENNWVQLARRQLRTEQVDITFKVSGRGGSGYVSRGLSGTTLGEEAARLMESDEDLVIIFGGSNDSTAPPESVTASVRQTLSDVRTRAPTAKRIVVGPVWPGPGHDPVPEILQIRDIVREEAEKTNSTFVDPIADEWFMGDSSQLISEDGIHPTDMGHMYISERLLPVIRSILAPPPVSGG